MIEGMGFYDGVLKTFLEMNCAKKKHLLRICLRSIALFIYNFSSIFRTPNMNPQHAFALNKMSSKEDFSRKGREF
jgi:hypothetical protein